MSCGVEDRLREADEEANSDDMVRCFGCRKGESEEGPNDFAGWNPNARPDLGEDNLWGHKYAHV